MATSPAELGNTMERLLTHVRGNVLLPEDDGYAAACSGHNTTVEHRPKVAVVADNPGDVREAVRFARHNGLPVAVRATGHGPAAPADGAVLVNTSRLNEVRIDPHARTARVEAGARWEQVITAAAEFGLAPPSGSSATVGAVGYTLGGGIGPLGRSYGYAADHVHSLELVTADGAARTASAAQNPDLFWALRGGKGNFGVVTSMTINLFPVSRLYGGGLFFPGEEAETLLRTYREWTATLPVEMASALALVRFPDAEGVPDEIRGRFAVHARIAYLGTEEEGRKLLEPIRRAAPLLMDTVADMPFTSVATINNDPTTPGPYIERSTVLDDLTPPAIERVLSWAGPGTDCPLVAVELRHLGGALSHAPAGGNAVSNRDRAFTVFAVAVPEPDGETVRNYQDGMITDLAPYGSGGPFLSFLSSSETDTELVRSAYDPSVYQRLAEVKRTHDPDNTFRKTHNIPPAR
ncbi:FAD/FMN-containing dehydrogenase [Haloactinospora alba]|uniref:FAD/FMN-containing dehydrogenase n=1 Tax=Haloactinospora alba TaxID=405555 RepID=A0A543N8Y1_9ACTN|nr:FAD-binding oxidoreductase [Haloactinospora alba]TQN28296.1 FAD/FMN-containing dehydrogenase [Haloactinospora alba]